VNVTRILSVVALLTGMVGGSLLADGAKDPAQSQGQQPSTTAAPRQGDVRRAPSQNSRGASGSDVRPWWKDAQTVKELALTPVQVDKIDRIYEERQRAIKTEADEHQLLMVELNRVLKEKKAKPSDVEALARKLTYPHLRIDVSRIRMLYEMSLVLKPEQQEKFDRLENERRERGRGPGPGRNSGTR
jgi:Spy/CpxP family protein refolding chaperone